jgi:hypothetical protein
MNRQIILLIMCYLLTCVSMVIGQCSFTITSTNCSDYGNANGSATAIPLTGTPPFTFIWNTSPPQTTAGVINLIAGTYIVTVTDSTGCVMIDTVVITEPDMLTDSIILADSICFGDCTLLSAYVYGGTAPYYFQLTPSAGTGYPPWTVCPDTNTLYTLVVTDYHGCMNTFSKMIYVVDCSSIIQFEQEPILDIYPNPVSDKLNISYSGKLIPDFCIYNIVGKLLFHSRLIKKENIVDISCLPDGLFIIQVTVDDWTVLRRIIKE